MSYVEELDTHNAGQLKMDWVFALVSGSAFYLAYQPWSSGYFSLVAVLLLALAIHNARSPWVGGLLAFLGWLGMGLAAVEGAGVRLWWSLPVILMVFGAPWFAAGTAFVALRRRLSPSIGWVLLPLLLLAAEVIVGQRWLWGDFSAALLAYTQADTVFKELAAWSGATTVTAAVLFVGAGAAAILNAHRALGGAFIAIPIALTFFPVPGAQSATGSEELMRLAVVQSAQPREVRHAIHDEPGALGRVMGAYEPLVAQAVAEGAELIVLGENVLPLLREGVPGSVSQALSGATAVVVGGPEIQGGRIYNSAFLWNGETLASIYRKQALVPLIESQYSAGYSSAPYVLGGRSIGFGICLDSLHAHLARDTVRQGAELLVYMTDDSFAGHTATPYMHMATAALRAAETGRYTVFANEWGPSAVFDQQGRAVAELPMGEPSVLHAQVALLAGITPYGRFGDTLAPLSVLVLLVLVGVGLLSPVAVRHRRFSGLGPTTELQAEYPRTRRTSPDGLNVAHESRNPG